MKKIMVVDDDVFNLHLVAKSLENNYEVIKSESANEALRILRSEPVHLVLLDHNMPEMTGLEMLGVMKRDVVLADIPVMVLTGEHDPALEVDCFKCGAEDVVNKPYVSEILCSRISRILELYALRKRLQDQLALRDRQAENVVLNSLLTIGNLVDSKDASTKGHSRRVANYSAALARNLGWNDAKVRGVYYGGLLHDIGKIGIPDAIIHKGRDLTPEERYTLKNHTWIGGEMLNGIHVAAEAARVAMHHHERYDGTGYPSGLKGDAIPIEARIVCIANTLDHMTSVVGKSEAEIVRALSDGRGTKFDPALVDLTIKLYRDGTLERDQMVEDLIVMSGQSGAEEGTRLLCQIMESNSREVRADAMIDALTGLYNRNYMENYMAERLESGRRGIFCMLDIDHFKQINDTYGHVVGDHVLEELGRMLKESVGDEGIACRMGGDEFAVFFTRDIGREVVEEWAADLNSTYRERITKREKIRGSSLSLGIAFYPDHGSDYERLYSSADMALYCSKRNGKGRYSFYDPKMNVNEEESYQDDGLEMLDFYIQEGGAVGGTYKVEYSELRRIYNFIARSIERTGQQAFLVMLTLRNIGMIDAEQLDDEITNLETAVAGSLRQNDVYARYSKNQLLVLLMGIGSENIGMVEDRIAENYKKIRVHDNYRLEFDQQMIEKLRP